MELNYFLLKKLGWESTSESFIFRHWSNSVDIDKLKKLIESDKEIFSILRESLSLVLIDNKLICIKELSDIEKQKSNNLYKILEMEYSDSKIWVTESFDFFGNTDMFKRIIKKEYCLGKYARHFRINKILK